MVDGLVLGERQHVIRAVDRRRRRIDEVRDAACRQPSSTWPNAIDVVAQVGVRIDERIAHARLRGEVHDRREGPPREQCAAHAARVGEIDALEREARIGRERRDARLLQRDVVVRIEIVDAVDVARRHRAVRARRACR